MFLHISVKEVLQQELVPREISFPFSIVNKQPLRKVTDTPSAKWGHGKLTVPSTVVVSARYSWTNPGVNQLA